LRPTRRQLDPLPVFRGNRILDRDRCSHDLGNPHRVRRQLDDTALVARIEQAADADTVSVARVTFRACLTIVTKRSDLGRRFRALLVYAKRLLARTQRHFGGAVGIEETLGLRKCVYLVACVTRVFSRSEERRVGKECRSRWWTDH